MKLFLFMVLLHLFADFTLQGVLADLKQRSWWRAQCQRHGVSSNLYDYDHICGLVCHSLYWTLLTFSPLIFLMSSTIQALVIVAINTVIHAVTDNAKANKHKINLIQDQLLHLAQIAFTVVFFV